MVEDRGVENHLATEQLSGFDIKLPLASQNELGSVPFVYDTDWRIDTIFFSLKCLLEFSGETSEPCAFVLKSH